MFPYVISSLRRRLEEVNLEEALEVEVRHFILVRYTKELRELGIG